MKCPNCKTEINSAEPEFKFREEIAKLHEQLAAAAGEKLIWTQASINDSALYEAMKQRAEAAEAKLKAANEQEPRFKDLDTDWMYSVLRYADKNPDFFPDVALGKYALDESLVATIANLYATPIPQADVQELQSMLDARIEAQHTLAVRAHDYEQRIAELERELAEAFTPEFVAELLSKAREEGRKEAKGEL